AALSSKRRTRMLNKGIQAGALEIVSSGTRRKTRDVGVTFPTPRSSLQPGEPAGARPAPRSRRSRLHCQPGQQQGRAGTALARPLPALLPRGLSRGPPGRIVSNLLSLSTGTLWFVPAEDLKRESRKENQSSGTPGPGPAWFEPWSSTKPWREPLREKNWEEQPSTGQAAHPG
ncbi:ALMS1 protein, partial [Regulus satrapa]|nr:ALMS1 protein [Regulus satrapa]